MKLLSVFLFFIAGFSFVYAEVEVQQPVARMGVAQQDAIARRELIEGNVHYDLFFDLTLEEKFGVVSAVTFSLSQMPENQLFLDFSGGEVLALEVNGQTTQAVREGEKLLLPTELLHVGGNKVVATTRASFSDSMKYSKDAADGGVYIYTNFEPNLAAMSFACFDQPDIRCSVTTRVKSTASTVLANGPEASVEGDVHTFSQVDTLSTYLICVASGPFKCFVSTDAKIPLRIFARASFAECTEEMAQKMMKATETLINHFESTFGIAYPYAKLDQFFAPDYPWGAMENPGLMPYGESWLTGNSDKKAEWSGLVAVVAHELAHIWYGDLVTVKWWDMLPLKESFASYYENAACMNLQKELSLEIHPLVLNAAWGMSDAIYSDNNPSLTRPLLGTEIPHSQLAADKLYDNITYPKGACVLWQLKSLVGEELFNAGLRKYIQCFKGHSGGYEEFRGIFAVYLNEILENQDMATWANEWVFSAGVNHSRVVMDVDDMGRIEDLLILQDTDPISGIYRLHHTEIAFLSVLDGQIFVQRVDGRFYDGAVTDLSADYRGQKAPDAILLNYSSMDYVTSSLDQRSVQALSKEDVSKIQDPLVRYGIYAALIHNIGREITPEEVLASYESDVNAEADYWVKKVGNRLLTAARNQIVTKAIAAKDITAIEKWLLENKPATTPAAP